MFENLSSHSDCLKNLHSIKFTLSLKGRVLVSLKHGLDCKAILQLFSLEPFVSKLQIVVSAGIGGSGNRKLFRGTSAAAATLPIPKKTISVSGSFCHYFCLFSRIFLKRIDFKRIRKWNSLSQLLF